MVAGRWESVVDGRRTRTAASGGGGDGRPAWRRQGETGDRAWATGHPASTVEAMGDRPARRRRLEAGTTALDGHRAGTAEPTGDGGVRLDRKRLEAGPATPVASRGGAAASLLACAGHGCVLDVLCGV